MGFYPSTTGFSSFSPSFHGLFTRRLAGCKKCKDFSSLFAIDGNSSVLLQLCDSDIRSGSRGCEGRLKKMLPRRLPDTAIVGPRTPQAIAFMHIPKTAGLSVAHAFVRALGEDQCTILSPVINDSDFENRRFVSGHLVLSTITPNCWRFTFLRHPLAQIVSHLRWLDHYNEPQFEAEAAGFSASTKAVIQRVRTTDFTSARALASFFAWLPEDSDVRLINVQAEVMARRFDRIAYHDATELAEQAIANLDQLRFVGVVERMRRDLPLLFRRLDLKGRPAITRQNNISSRRKIDVRDPAIRRVLEGFVGADLRLYRHVAPRRGLFGSIGRLITSGR